jgi:hypothetical protein
MFFYERACGLKTKLSHVSLQFYVHVFLFVKIASVFCWSKNSMLCVFLVIRGLQISCLVFFVLCRACISNIYGLFSMSIVCLVYFLWIFCFASSHFHILFSFICG